jgi:hypothetical protein
MKKYITVAIVLLIIVIGYFLFRGKKAAVPASTEPTPISQTLNLSADWKTISQNETSVKLEKDTATGLKPVVVFKQTSSKDALTPSKYVDSIKAGAKATLPSLVYQTDKRNSLESGYSALLTGYYLNQGKKVFIDQRVYIQSETVSTFTGSFEGDLAAEVARVLSSLSQEKIGQ